MAGSIGMLVTRVAGWIEPSRSLATRRCMGHGGRSREFSSGEFNVQGCRWSVAGGFGGTRCERDSPIYSKPLPGASLVETVRDAPSCTRCLGYHRYHRYRRNPRTRRNQYDPGRVATWHPMPGGISFRDLSCTRRPLPGVCIRPQGEFVLDRRWISMAMGRRKRAGGIAR